MEEKLKALLAFPAEVSWFEVIDSTNSEAKRRIKQGKSCPLLLVANEQTAGRGRQGKSFYSPAKTGIYMSLAVRPEKELSSSLGITSAAAVAVCRAIEELTELKPEIKWVNDVYVGGRKVCGILTEAVSAENKAAVIVGIGINLTTADFPSGTENAGCLGVQLDRAELAAKISNGLYALVDTDGKEYMDYYRAHSMIKGKKINVIKNGAAIPALALKIDNNGGLLVRYENESEETLISGEITIRQREE